MIWFLVQSEGLHVFNQEKKCGTGTHCTEQYVLYSFIKFEFMKFCMMVMFGPQTMPSFLENLNKTKG